MVSRVVLLPVLPKLPVSWQVHRQCSVGVRAVVAGVDLNDVRGTKVAGAAEEPAGAPRGMVVGDRMVVWGQVAVAMVRAFAPPVSPRAVVPAPSIVLLAMLGMSRLAPDFHAAAVSG